MVLNNVKITLVNIQVAFAIKTILINIKVILIKNQY